VIILTDLPLLVVRTANKKKKRSAEGKT
jgi:hypothetical protein